MVAAKWNSYESRERLIKGLQNLEHKRHEPMVKIYGPLATVGRGGMVAFNLIDPKAREMDYRLVETRAVELNISIRTGCFCNSGAAEFAFQYGAVEAYKCFNLLSPGCFSLQVRRLMSASLLAIPSEARVAPTGLSLTHAKNCWMLGSFRDYEAEEMVEPKSPSIVGG